MSPSPAPEFALARRSLRRWMRSYGYRVFAPPPPATGGPLPVILALHGSGERGDDGERHTRVGFGAALRRDPALFPAIVVLPQAPAGGGWRGRMLDVAWRALEEATSEFGGDPARRYLTGISMGGHGAWHLALARPRAFAALVPVCGWLGSPRGPGVRPPSPRFVSEAARRLRHIPTWVFHGARDPVIPPARSRLMVEALQQAGGAVRYTEYAEVGHDAWTPAYAEPALMTWMLEQRLA